MTNNPFYKPAMIRITEQKKTTTPTQPSKTTTNKSSTSSSTGQKAISTPQTPQEVIDVIQGQRPVVVPSNVPVQVASKVETREPVYEPVHEYSQQSVSSKIETQQKQQFQQLTTIKPSDFYITEDKKLVTGYEASKQTLSNLQSLGQTQKEIKQFPTGTTFTQTKQGYTVNIPEDVPLRAMKLYRSEADKLPPGLSEISRFGMGISSSMHSLTKPIADILGVGKQYDIGLSFAYSGAVHPFDITATSKTFQEGLKLSRYGVHYPSSMDILFEPIGWAPKGTTKFITSDPWFFAGGIGGEVAQSIGFTQIGRAAKTGLKYVIGLPKVQTGITKITSTITRGTPSIISKAGVYMPETLKNTYSKFFGKTIPGMFNVDVGRGTIKRSGGLVSKFMYESKYALKGGSAGAFFLKEQPQAAGKIVAGLTRTESKNLFASMLGAKGQAKYGKYLIGLPTITEPTGYILKKVPGLNLAYTSIKRKLLIGTRSMWTTRTGLISSISRTGKMIGISPTDITGFAAKTKYKVSGLFGRKIDVSRSIITANIRSWDDITRIGMNISDDLVKPVKKLVPSTVKGATPFEVTGGAFKQVFHMPTALIDEVSYKPVSRLFPENIMFRGATSGLGKTLIRGSMYGAGFIGVKFMMRGLTDISMPSIGDLSMQGFKTITHTRILKSSTGVLSDTSVKNIQNIGYGTLDIDITGQTMATGFDSMIENMTDVGTVTMPKYKTTTITAMSLEGFNMPEGGFLGFPKTGLYGRGIGSFGGKNIKPYYKFRMFKMPAIDTLVKKMRI